MRLIAWFLHLRTRYLKPGNYLNPLSLSICANGSWTHTTNICHGTLICFLTLGAEKKKINTGAWKCHCDIYICLLGTTTYLWCTYMSLGIQRVNCKLFTLYYQHCTSLLDCTWNSSEWYKQYVLSWTWTFLPSQLKEITQVIV